jgi:hypothetical protein
MNSSVHALAVDGTGNLYAGGDFTTAGGTAANRIAKWNGTTWSALGIGMDGAVVRTLVVDGRGNLYAGGLFTMAGGTAASNIAKWNGTTWNSLGTGLNRVSGVLTVDGSGTVYAGGSFSTVGDGSKVTAYFGAYWPQGAPTPTIVPQFGRTGAALPKSCQQNRVRGAAD